MFAVSEARMLSLDGEWFACRIGSAGRCLWFEDTAQPIRGGMSGSPILLPDGSAIGVVCVGEGVLDQRTAPGTLPAAGVAGACRFLNDEGGSPIMSENLVELAQRFIPRVVTGSDRCGPILACRSK